MEVAHGLPCKARNGIRPDASHRPGISLTLGTSHGWLTDQRRSQAEQLLHLPKNYHCFRGCRYGLSFLSAQQQLSRASACGSAAYAGSILYIHGGWDACVLAEPRSQIFAMIARVDEVGKAQEASLGLSCHQASGAWLPPPENAQTVLFRAGAALN